jgi:hypothetical protein
MIERYNHSFVSVSFSSIVELMVPLTWPADKESTDYVGQVESLQGYKEAIMGPNVLAKIKSFLWSLLAIHPMYDMIQ